MKEVVPSGENNVAYEAFDGTTELRKPGFIEMCNHAELTVQAMQENNRADMYGIIDKAEIALNEHFGKELMSQPVIVTGEAYPLRKTPEQTDTKRKKVSLAGENLEFIKIGFEPILEGEKVNQRIAFKMYPHDRTHTSAYHMLPEDVESMYFTEITREAIDPDKILESFRQMANKAQMLVETSAYESMSRSDKNDTLNMLESRDERVIKALIAEKVPVIIETTAYGKRFTITDRPHSATFVRYGDYDKKEAGKDSPATILGGYVTRIMHTIDNHKRPLEVSSSLLVADPRQSKEHKKPQEFMYRIPLRKIKSLQILR